MAELSYMQVLLFNLCILVLGLTEASGNILKVAWRQGPRCFWRNPPRGPRTWVILRIYVLVKTGKVRLQWQSNPKSQWFNTIRFISHLCHMSTSDLQGSVPLTDPDELRLCHFIAVSSGTLTSLIRKRREISQVRLPWKQTKMILCRTELIQNWSMRKRGIGWAKRITEHQ